jgi:hypothetical protein
VNVPVNWEPTGIGSGKLKTCITVRAKLYVIGLAKAAEPVSTKKKVTIAATACFIVASLFKKS